MSDFIKTFMRRFAPLGGDAVELPKKGALDLASNELVHNSYKYRYAFYTNLKAAFESNNPNVVNDLLKILSLTNGRTSEIDGTLRRITDLVKTNKNDLSAIREAVDNALASSMQKPLMQKGGDPTPLGVTPTIPAKPSLQRRNAIADLHRSARNSIENFRYDLSKNDLTNSISGFENATPAEKKTMAELFYKHPIYSPNNDKVQLSDRAVFIALTFIIRGISIFIAEWAIFSGYVLTYSGAFNMYFGIYLCVFALLIIITNARKDDMIFKMMLFYINTDSEDGRGLMRVIVHLACIMFIIPIPYILKEYRNADTKAKILTFTEKSKILSALDSFSLYVWVLTSIVALNL